MNNYLLINSGQIILSPVIVWVNQGNWLSVILSFFIAFSESADLELSLLIREFVGNLKNFTCIILDNF